MIRPIEVIGGSLISYSLGLMVSLGLGEATKTDPTGGWFEQIPSLAALVWLVIVAIKDRRRGEEMTYKAFAARDKLIDKISTESNETSVQTRLVIQELNTLLKANTEALTRLVKVHQESQNQ